MYRIGSQVGSLRLSVQPVLNACFFLSHIFRIEEERVIGGEGASGQERKQSDTEHTRRNAWTWPIVRYAQGRFPTARKITGGYSFDWWSEKPADGPHGALTQSAKLLHLQVKLA